MSNAPAIERNMTVERLLQLWPQTARVFIDKRMACVGCPVAGFETIEEVAAIYEQDPESFVQTLKRCAAAQHPEAESSHEQANDED